LPPDTACLVDEAVRAALSGQAADVIGLSLLADGADQIIAGALLDLGGHTEAVIPAARYREGLPSRSLTGNSVLVVPDRDTPSLIDD